MISFLDWQILKLIDAVMWRTAPYIHEETVHDRDGYTVTELWL